MNEEIKSCPFCGRKVIIYYSSTTNAFYALHYDEQQDADCILITPMIIRGKFTTLKQAREAWNRRVKENENN